jgi:hypothetical protein
MTPALRLNSMHRCVSYSQSQTHPQTIQDNLSAAVTYFQNHLHQMNYAFYRDQHYPIGSGVTEAACKTVIKQRLCCSGDAMERSRCSRGIEFKNLSLNINSMESILE